MSAFTLEAYAPAPETTDPRIPPRNRVVTRDLLDRWAQERPDKVFVKFSDNDETWTYREFRDMVIQTAVGLQDLGVAQGHHVLVWMPNSRENLRVYFAISYLGAVYVPINTAYRGALLEHVIDNSDAALAIVHTDLVERMQGIRLAKLTDVVVLGKPAQAPAALRQHAYADVLLPTEGVLRAPARRIEPWDPFAIIYTSGTTGLSKGVYSSYLHLYTNAGPETWHFVTEDDRFMMNMPMFHIGGMGVTYVMFARGASITFVERFDTSTFWDVVRRTETTACFLLGVMAVFLEKLPPKPDDADNPMRLVFMVPLAGDIAAFSKRFGLDVYTIFNMTEISSPIVSEVNPKQLGACGKVRPGVEVRLVDGNDCEVPRGATGEMMVRTDRPWGMNSGYYKNPEATARAWRNGWFHTGDMFRQDEEGNFYFVDRAKDAIRRRGENISSFEVEADVMQFPSVREAAAVGVPSELSEDEVLVAVAPVEGQTMDPAALIEFLRARMAHFMIPRYIRVLDELPKTPTAKVRKNEIRDQGVTADTWDREAAGITIKMDRFSKVDA